MATERSLSSTESDIAKVLSTLQTISQQLDLLIGINEKTLETQNELLQRKRSRSEDGVPLDALSLLNLPFSLRKTVMALYKLEKATADDISSETKRLRGVESSSANQLVRLGYLRKMREGRKVYFCIEPSMEMKK